MPTTKSSNRIAKQEKKYRIERVNSYVQDEITRLVQAYNIDRSFLEEFALFVVKNNSKKEKIVKPLKIKPLALSEIKLEVYKHFSVKNTTELKKSGSFNMAIDGIDKLNLTVKSEWEKLYRKFVGFLPNEENQQGDGCINGVNIFNYFKPWEIFDLDATVATTQDVKDAYYRLSKIYHPDVQITGNAEIFDRITVMYKSITSVA